MSWIKYIALTYKIKNVERFFMTKKKRIFDVFYKEINFINKDNFPKKSKFKTQKR